MTYKEEELKRVYAKRLSFIIFLGCFFWLIFVVRLFYLQVAKSEEYKKIALNQHQLKMKLEAKRGVIYDRNLQVLAFNLPTRSFFAVPGEIKNLNLTSKRISSITREPEKEIKNRLFEASHPKGGKEKRKFFVWIKRKTEKDEEKKLSSLGLPGIYSMNETKRYYPYYPLARDVLGFTDIDNQGLAGVEYNHNRVLKGVDGEGAFLRDALGNSYRTWEYPITEPRPGLSLVLTLDLNLQSILEEELKKAIEKTSSDGGSGVLMDPKTGEILAMAYQSRDDMTLPSKNRVIADNFEPGSTFKIVTACAALEEKVKKPEDKIWAEQGKFKVGKKIIHDVHSYGWLTFKECVVFSSNIGMSKIALQLGKYKVFKYAQNFGFGSKTGLELPGESRGQLSLSDKRSDISLCNLAIGQGVATTALQLISAYAAIANRGAMMKPFIVKKIMDEEGNIIREFHPTKVRDVVSRKTAQIMIDFLKDVVSTGTGKPAQMEGINIAGKTGTAQKAKTNGRGYEDKYVASFVGFFPAEEPKIVGLITLDNPKGAHFGSQTAAPAFKEIASKIIPLQQKPLLDSETKIAYAKGVSASLTGQTGEKEIAKGLTSVTQGLSLEKSKYSLGKPEGLYSNGGKENGINQLAIYVEKGKEQIQLPDVSGLTVREAVYILSVNQIKFKLIGSGVVTAQIPPAGTILFPGEICEIKCEPK
jgi:cell division protein FtsI/penicillin-binding protein 2